MTCPNCNYPDGVNHYLFCLAGFDCQEDYEKDLDKQEFDCGFKGRKPSEVEHEQS